MVVRRWILALWVCCLLLVGFGWAGACVPDPATCEGSQCQERSGSDDGGSSGDVGDAGVVAADTLASDVASIDAPPGPPDRRIPPACTANAGSCAAVACCAGLVCDGSKLCIQPASGPVKVDKDEFTHLLKGSDAAFSIWTAPNTAKIQPTAAPPSVVAPQIQVYSAKHEFEPFQLLLRTTSATQVKVNWTAFPPNVVSRWSAAVVGYVKGMPETLTPLAANGSVALPAGANQALWFTLYVPPDAPAGDHQAQISLTINGKSYVVPVHLHIFDFALPKEVHFYSQMNLSMESLMDKTGSYQEQLDRAKSFMIEHRFTPKAPLWPSGFSYNITWDSKSNPQRCQAFWDEPTEGKPYSIKHLAARYGLGLGWNDGVGFPSFMLYQFVDNSTPRPANFCDVPRGSAHEGTAEYNAAYSRYLKALEGYLLQEKMIDKAYVYVMNEPQDDKDHALAAHLCRVMKAAAPRLKIAISEEPKASIFQDPKGACGYDIWIAHIRAYDPVYKVAWERQQKHGEKVWWYSLDHDAMPYFNPTLVERSGMDCRVIPWLSWRFRVEGWAYYNMGAFLNGRQPTIRFELMREGFEDYEYLWLANQKQRPAVGQDAIPDPSVNRLVSSLTSFSRDPAALTKLRIELGRYLGKERKDLPLIEAETSTRPRQAYYINFQDPKGQPATTPLVVGSKTYLKVGWDAYDEKKGYGWFGEYIGNPKIAKYQWLTSPESVSPLQRSILFDDYGRKNTFAFDLPNGAYDVTISVGWHGKTYKHHQVWIEGEQVIKGEQTDASNKHYIVRTHRVELQDGKLTLEMGGKSPVSNDFEYTMLNYLEVVPR